MDPKVVNIWLFVEVEVKAKVKVEGLFCMWTKFICKRSKISLKSKKKWGITKKRGLYVIVSLKICVCDIYAYLIDCLPKITYYR